ncbi:MAG: hypothetical protein N3I35_00780 [Clostridia bacterium]|nr:hypothetical protein [Clostridia bacterium]
MKVYVKPVFQYVELRAEERLAGSPCVLKDGACTIDGGKTIYKWWEGLNG